MKSDGNSKAPLLRFRDAPPPPRPPVYPAIAAVKKKWQLVVWGVGMALALAVAMRLWANAFPVAAVQFPLARDQVQARLAVFAAEMGAPVGECRSAIHFGEATATKNYLERQFGPARMAESARQGVAIWFWTARWFKPGQREEYQAWSNQAGDVVGFWHKIEEERPCPAFLRRRRARWRKTSCGNTSRCIPGPRCISSNPARSRNRRAKITPSPGSKMTCAWATRLTSSS